MNRNERLDALTDALVQTLHNEKVYYISHGMLRATVDALCSSQHGADLLRAYIDEALEEAKSVALTRIFLSASGLTEEEAEEEIRDGFRWENTREAPADNDTMDVEEEACL